MDRLELEIVIGCVLRCFDDIPRRPPLSTSDCQINTRGTTPKRYTLLRLDISILEGVRCQESDFFDRIIVHLLGLEVLMPMHENAK